MKKIAKELLIFITCIIVSMAIYCLSIYIYYDIQFKNIPKLTIKMLQHPKDLKLEAFGFLAIPFFFPFLYIILKVKKILDNLELGDKDYGQARFAVDSDIVPMGLNYKNGLVLGLNKIKKFVKFSKPMAVLIIAPPGAGKTAGIIVPNLLEIPQSSIVLDVKGELCQLTREYREKEFNNKILIFNPFGVDNSLYFNPFDKSVVKDLNFSKKSRLVNEIAEIIFVVDKGKDDHWSKSAKNLFSFFAKYELVIKNHSSLPLIAQAPIKDYYDELIGEFKAEASRYGQGEGDEEKIEKNPDEDTLKIFFKQVANHKYQKDELYGTTVEEWTLIQNEARKLLNSAEEEFASIISTFDTFMQVFKNPDIINVTQTMNLEYESFREKPTTLYIKIQETDLGTLAPLIRILLENITKNLMLKENSDSKKFIYYYLDEITRFGTLKYIIELPQLCRSFGLIPIFVSQSYEQIKEKYSNETMDMLIANCYLQLVFRMNSFKDAEIVSKTIGNFTRNKKSKSQSGFKEANISTSAEGYALLTPQDIMNQDSNNLLVLISGFKNKPLILKINFYFKNKKYKVSK